MLKLFFDCSLAYKNRNSSRNPTSSPSLSLFLVIPLILTRYDFLGNHTSKNRYFKKKKNQLKSKNQRNLVRFFSSALPLGRMLSDHTHLSIRDDSTSANSSPQNTFSTNVIYFRLDKRGNLLCDQPLEMIIMVYERKSKFRFKFQ